ncbi:pimeloyl-ACP methyl ester carboxylesterase [Pseudomonas sp. JUb42]|uniref:alpha/beta fold hydrolase n=1 Tax=Pseudomonas sp. JUb42 TaxID=2940611 RepID=UPI00216949AA|nr:alpha/beta hydrolase [Pseudomonas sp. JUb42]MCS3470053.1 pimeloyl-ACP methyl ester carboxylesterase [Pseudomonas sp. JUb42]
MIVFNTARALRHTFAIAILAAACGTLTAQASTAPATSNVAHSYTHQTAPTRFVEVDGARLAYRRFGKPSGVPLVFLQHFVGNLDSWDPQVIDGFAHDREVILFDNAGVASSSGEVPNNIEDMAQYAAGLLKALNVKKADLLGFSMGSLIAQQVTLDHPDLVRRLILVGSSPRGGVGMAALTPEFQGYLAKKREVPDELLLDVFFTQTPESQASGHEFLNRLRARKVDRDVDVNGKTAPAQAAAIAGWGASAEHANDYLKAIKQPTLVVAGSNDIVFYTANDVTLQQNLPNAQLVIYPDSNHGAIYQYPDLFVKHATLFLNAVK